MVEVDINSLVFANNTNTTSMFNKCTALTTIYRNDHLEDVLDATKSPMMFNECVNLPHYDGTSDKTYAYPDNGESGYFTSARPRITLNPFVGGHYQTLTGDPITYLEGEVGFGQIVQVVFDAGYSDYSLKDAYNNAGGHYDIGAANTFTVPFEKEYNITVVIGKKIEAYAALSTKNSENDTLTFKYDGDRYLEVDQTFDVGGSGDPAWAHYMFGSGATITNVVIESSFNSFKPTSTYS